MPECSLNTNMQRNALFFLGASSYFFIPQSPLSRCTLASIDRARALRGACEIIPAFHEFNPYRGWSGEFPDPGVTPPAIHVHPLQGWIRKL